MANLELEMFCSDVCNYKRLISHFRQSLLAGSSSKRSTQGPPPFQSQGLHPAGS